MTIDDATVIEIGTGSSGRGRHGTSRRFRAAECLPTEIPQRIESGLNDAVELRREAPLPEAGAGPEVWAAWSARLALSHARAAGWWGVLARWTVTQTDVPMLYIRAVRTAQHADRANAKHWQQAAQKWQARTVAADGAAAVGGVR